MNVGKLSEIVREGGAARTIFEVLSKRERPREITDLRRLKNEILSERRVTINTKDLLEFFQKLQKAGFGTVINRRSSEDPYRFKWRYNLVAVGKAALGEKTPEPGAPMVADDSLTVPYPLRGRIYNIQIPRDISRIEAKDLAELILRYAR